MSCDAWGNTLPITRYVVSISDPDVKERVQYMLESKGAKVTAAVSKVTDFVVVDKNDTRRETAAVKKAKEFGVQVVDFNTLNPDKIIKSVSKTQKASLKETKPATKTNKTKPATNTKQKTTTKSKPTPHKVSSNNITELTFDIYAHMKTLMKHDGSSDDLLFSILDESYYNKVKLPSKHWSMKVITPGRVRFTGPVAEALDVKRNVQKVLLKALKKLAH